MLQIIINIILSLFIIYIGHLLFDYLKNKYSKEIVKDIIGTQTKKYQQIIHEIQEKKEMHENLDKKEDIKEDLENFMKTLENNINN